MDADGTHKRWARPLPSTFSITDPSWSPDGSRLGVTVWLQGLPYVATMKVATGELNFLSSALGGPRGRFPSYDPTGKKIICLGSWDKSLDQVNADGSAPSHKTLVSEPVSTLGRPSFSPDGKRIAFDKNVGGNIDVFVKNLVDGTVKRLATPAGYDAQPTWSPDGSRIVFRSNRSGQLQIWTMSNPGGSLLRITHTATAEGDPAWSH